MLLGILCVLFIALNILNIFISFPNKLFVESALFINCLAIAAIFFAKPEYAWAIVYLILAVIWFFTARRTYKLIVKLDKMFK